MLRDFCEQELRPRAEAVDRSGQPDPAMLRWMGELGFFGIPFSQEYGGAGAGEMGYCIMMEELNRACPSTATIIGAHVGIAAMSLYLVGSPELKRKYLPGLGRGEQIGAFGMTGQNAGCVGAGTRLRAMRGGGL